MSVSLLQLIETRLADHSHGKKLLRRFLKRAAVAMILQVRAGQLHILMIKRAQREGDPWSGHMAFPGGRMDRIDAHGYAVAVRETEEEVGLTLGENDECIGRLSDLSARPRRGMFGMTVSPFVFRLDRDVVFNPNHEVAEVVWVPLEFLSDPGNREEMVMDIRGLKMSVPCYHYEGHCIWGLSLMMLDELLDLVTQGSSGRRQWRWKIRRDLPKR